MSPYLNEPLAEPLEFCEMTHSKDYIIPQKAHILHGAIPFPIANASFCSKKALNCKETDCCFLTLKIGNGVRVHIRTRSPTCIGSRNPKIGLPEGVQPSQC
jgi:hypothetical protein